MFVIVGIWLAQDTGWIGYLCAGFFALGVPVAIIQLLPGSSYLRIADDGLSFANLYRETNIPWSAIDHFSVVTIKQTGITVNKMVGFNFVPTYEPAKIGRRISTAIAQCEGALPDTYGLTAEELADLLNERLAEYNRSTDEQKLECNPR